MYKEVIENKKEMDDIQKKTQWKFQNKKIFEKIAHIHWMRLVAGQSKESLRTKPQRLLKLIIE